ncbi:MAG: hypothetical protein KIT57_11925 [Blastocatellales bacterium]|nr:hypothetical protein [Blastocatellales bacterium]
MDDAEHQDVEIGSAELPVGAVQSHLPRPGHSKQFDDALGDICVWKFKEPEEALQLLGCGIAWLSRPKRRRSPSG